jgi:hypothetical protein
VPKPELGQFLVDLPTKQSFSLSRARFRPPENIHKRSRLRLTNRTLPRFTATSLEDFAISPMPSEKKQNRQYINSAIPNKKLKSPGLAASDSKRRHDLTVGTARIM